MSMQVADGGELTIDLDALARNYQTLRATAAGAECAGVLKADAYGLGMRPVAQRLWAEGCRSFFVAQLHEAAGLRSYLPAEAAIYVLNGFGGSDPSPYLEIGAIPVLNHLGDIDRWAALARQRGEKLPAVLHLDTGMNRLGLGPEEIERLIDTADRRLPYLDVRYYMSHLACGARPDHPMNVRQQRGFKRLVRRLPEAPITLANSAGVFLGAAYHGDLVRPGIALYGSNPSPDGPQALPDGTVAPVVHLQAPILQTRHAESPMTVGYDAGYEPHRPSLIATLGLGYGDGYPRTIFTHGPAFVARAGQCARVVGKVSMDLLTVDVTDLPGPAPEPGDMMEVLGETVTVDHLARAAGTNGYEILTRLGSRYRRRYVGEAASPV